jgi:type II secretory pathway pseudopilin PulG
MGRCTKTGSAGYTLVAILIFMTILGISVLVIVPTVYKVMQREKEEELLFRGKEYAQFLVNYQRRRGTYPKSLKELMQTQPRSARKLYKDPMCDCSDWGLIHPGQPFPIPKTTDGEPAGVGGPTNPFTPSPKSSTTSPYPSTYGSPPTSGSGTSGSSAPGSGGSKGSGAGFSGDALFQDKGEEENLLPIIGVYSKVHKKGLRTFKGREYYDEWGFFAGQNNEDYPELQQLFGSPTATLSPSPSAKPPR